MAIGLSLLDLFALQRNDTLTGLVEDVTTLAPEMDALSAVPRKGTFYEIVRRTALPNSGFRNLNAGVVPGKSTYKKEVKEMFFLDAPINMDEAILQGDDATAGDAWMNESAGALRSAIITIGAQVWYGTSADAKGFAGIRAQCAGSVAAGGTTNSTSAYLLWEDPKWGVRFDVGMNGAINMRPPLRQQIADPNDSTKNLFAWVSNLSSFIGLTVVSDKATWAVTGITTHQTTGVYDQVMTDQIAASLIANIPAARRQNLRWFMNRTSEFILQQSRSTINVGTNTSSGALIPVSYQSAGAGGYPAWAPKPSACEGYPITITDSILNTESN